MKSIITFVKRRPVLSTVIAIAVIVVLGGGYRAFHGGATVDTVTVARKNVVQSVSVTGRVKPASSVDLAFERSGRVATTYVAVGDRVSQGKTLVVLDSADLYADLEQAQAQLQREQIKLADLKAGIRPEDIAIAQTAVDNAQLQLTQAKSSALSTIRDAWVKVDTAIHYRIDKFFSNARSLNPELVFQINDGQLMATIQHDRISLESMLSAWNSALIALYPTDDLTQPLMQAKTNLNTVKDFLDKLSFGVNALVANSQFSQATIDGYQADMSLARTDVSTAISNVHIAEQAVQTASSALTSANSQLNLQKAGYTANDIAGQDAQVRQQQGIVDSKRAAIGKNILSAPISGIISKQDAKVGQIAPAGSVLVSLLSDAQFEIEANIPESSIANITVGNSAQVTLDAYGTSAIFDATIVRIDPAESLIDGVATYKVTLQFNKADDRIRSGMTANLEIISATKDNVVTIPFRLVTTQNGQSTVQVQEGKVIVEKTVTLGLQGSNGDVEIVEGLLEGEHIIVPTK